jgi:hypothetical protein
MRAVLIPNGRAGRIVARKIVLLGLVAVGIGTASGCGGSGNEGSPDGGSDSAGDVGTVMVVAEAAAQMAPPCAAATSLEAVPNEINIGHAIPLTAAGIDPSGKSADVDLTWSSTSAAGILSDTTGSAVSFVCMSPGTGTITVTANMADGGPSCPGIGSLTIQVTCSTSM